MIQSETMESRKEVIAVLILSHEASQGTLEKQKSPSSFAEKMSRGRKESSLLQIQLVLVHIGVMGWPQRWGTFVLPRGMSLKCVS